MILEPLCMLLLAYLKFMRPHDSPWLGNCIIYLKSMIWCIIWLPLSKKNQQPNVYGDKTMEHYWLSPLNVIFLFNKIIKSNNFYRNVFTRACYWGTIFVQEVIYNSCRCVDPLGWWWWIHEINSQILASLPNKSSKFWCCTLKLNVCSILLVCQ
jgi:hypothetical protein